MRGKHRTRFSVPSRDAAFAWCSFGCFCRMVCSAAQREVDDCLVMVEELEKKLEQKQAELKDYIETSAATEKRLEVILALGSAPPP